MIVDGVGTLIGAILGCPFGTVVYIGHPVHKKVGAKTGYSLMNGCIYLVLTLSGIFPIILSLIPGIAIGPIIFIFGLMICTVRARPEQLNALAVLSVSLCKSVLYGVFVRARRARNS